MSDDIGKIEKDYIMLKMNNILRGHYDERKGILKLTDINGKEHVYRIKKEQKGLIDSLIGFGKDIKVTPDKRNKDFKLIRTAAALMIVAIALSQTPAVIEDIYFAKELQRRGVDPKTAMSVTVFNNPFIDERIAPIVEDTNSRLKDMFPNVRFNNNVPLAFVVNNNSVTQRQGMSVSSYYNPDMNALFINEEALYDSSHEGLHNMFSHTGADKEEYDGFKKLSTGVGEAINEGMITRLDCILNFKRPAYLEAFTISMLLSFVDEERFVKIMAEGTEEDLRLFLADYGDENGSLIDDMDNALKKEKVLKERYYNPYSYIDHGEFWDEMTATQLPIFTKLSKMFLYTIKKEGWDINDIYQTQPRIMDFCECALTCADNSRKHVSDTYEILSDFSDELAILAPNDNDGFIERLNKTVIEKALNPSENNDTIEKRK